MILGQNKDQKKNSRVNAAGEDVNDYLLNAFLEWHVYTAIIT